MVQFSPLRQQHIVFDVRSLLHCPPLLSWCRLIRPWFFVSCCPFSRCPPRFVVPTYPLPRFQPLLFWWYHDVHSRNFSQPYEQWFIDVIFESIFSIVRYSFDNIRNSWLLAQPPWMHTNPRITNVMLSANSIAPRRSAPPGRFVLPHKMDPRVHKPAE